jgi:hypothetical protein
VTVSDHLRPVSLDPHLHAHFTAEADLELARRSIVGTMAYFLLFLVLMMTTPYRRDHPLLFGVLGTLLFALGIVRWGSRFGCAGTRLS